MLPSRFTYALTHVINKESMMNKKILEVALRQNAIYIENPEPQDECKILNRTTATLVANVVTLGFGFSEELLHQINQKSASVQVEILEFLKEVLGVDKNWTPLVKGWDEPTGESEADHLNTFFANTFPYLKIKGTSLKCGHTIPYNTFPLDRYNGCPFCGIPFEFDQNINYGQGSRLKILELWEEKALKRHFLNLLHSKSALDTTQKESLCTLIESLPLPLNVEIEMKETLMLVITKLIDLEHEVEAGLLFKTPQDVMRYLWYKHTGFLQIVQPKVVAQRKMYNSQYGSDNIVVAKEKALKELKLKYTRKECKMIALWLNNLKLAPELSAELMHPKRAMWVRFIRALRLVEYSKKRGFENLAKLLDVFYNKKYTVWQGEVNKAREKMNSKRILALLQERPSSFARSLFATMLWFGADETLDAFSKISSQIPARLLATLSMYAPLYFNKEQRRSVKPLAGVNKFIAGNKTLERYEDKQLKEMVEKLEQQFLDEMGRRYAKQGCKEDRIYIDEYLFSVPLAIGDRGETVQDLPSDLMGTLFDVEGDKVRLFMEWGKGLPTQHLDMDISCQVAYENKVEECSYYNLDILGCKHSGDIQQIPDMIGTAEYIELELLELEKNHAKYVTFTGNAYSSGELEPNMVLGWMNSKYPMKISEKSGVAYDPSCVQHQVRITQSLSKGIVFGVLKVKEREIVWLEMSFQGQTVRTLDNKGVEALLAKLESKMSVGELLKIKSEAQGSNISENKDEADVVYDAQWVRDSALVTTELLVD